MKDSMTSTAATQQLKERHCPQTDVNYFNNTTDCINMVTEITPIMMTALGSWMMENQTDICRVNYQDPVNPELCDMCNAEIGSRIDQILSETWITLQKNRLFGNM